MSESLSTTDEIDLDGGRVGFPTRIDRAEDGTELFCFQYYSNLAGAKGEEGLKLGDRIRYVNSSGKECKRDIYYRGVVVFAEPSLLSEKIQLIKVAGEAIF